MRGNEVRDCGCVHAIIQGLQEVRDAGCWFGQRENGTTFDVGCCVDGVDELAKDLRVSDEEALVYDEIIGPGEDDDVAVDKGEIGVSHKVSHVRVGMLSFGLQNLVEATRLFDSPLSPWLTPRPLLLLVSSPALLLLPPHPQSPKGKSERPAPKAKHRVPPQKAPSPSPTTLP